MKKRLGKLIGKEKGQALPIALCLLALGSLVMVPLLNYMYTGLKTGEIYWETVPLSYAAEAGLEDGIWTTDKKDLTLSPYYLAPYDYASDYTYPLPEEINNMAVSVSIKRIWPLAGLESAAYGTTPATGLHITGGVVSTVGDYQIRISYDFPETELYIDQIAVWLPPDFAYVTDSSSGITTDDDVPENPTESDWNGGRVLRWNFSAPVDFIDLPEPGNPPEEEGGMQPAIEHPSIRMLEFEVTPEARIANGAYSWVRTTDGSRYLAWENSLNIYKIDSTATDSAGKNVTTEGYTYVSRGVESDWIDTGGSLFTGNYRAVGNTLMKDLNQDHVRETTLSESSATISNIPDEGEVAFAYLYWTGWRTSNEPDLTCTFKIKHAEMLRPSASGNHTECAPVGDTANYRCVDEASSDSDTTYVRTGHEFVILRPDQPGTYTQCDRNGGSYNYQRVDEAPADENDTYVYTRYEATETDTYNLPNPGLSGNISSVTVIIRSRATSGTHAVQTALRTNNNNYPGDYTTVSTSYTDISTTYNTNPYTLAAWTWAEINALEAGVTQHDLGTGDVRTTQVYVGVEYGTSPSQEAIDTYNTDNHTKGSGDIQSVTVCAQTKCTSSSAPHAAQTVLRTNGTDYPGTKTTVSTSYSDLSTTYTTNPYTGVAWTWAEVDALEAGVKHYDMGFGAVCTTQVYIEVDYGEAYQEEITADKWWSLANAQGYAYSCFKDVTDIVTSVAPEGNATYTVGGLEGNTGTEYSYTGWSLIVIYSSVYEEGHQFYLYDTLTHANSDSSGGFTIEGFTAPEDAQATLTCFVGEGDYWYKGDSLQLNGYYMTDAANPQDDVWNSQSSALSGELIEGVDIDTFDVSSPIINEGNTSATVSFVTGQDQWNLIYLILAFRCDLAILTPSGTGIFCYGFGGN